MKRTISPKEFADKMQKLLALNSDDEEGTHRNADALMCQVLRSLGYEVGVEIFEEMKKWYT